MRGQDRHPYCRSPYSTKLKILRAVWLLVWALLFVPSPRVFYGWRRFLFRFFGGRIGRGTILYPTCRISEPWKVALGDYTRVGPGVILYSGGGIAVGSYVIVSQYAHLCTSSHDYNDPGMRQTFAPILIADRAWICTDAFLGPGVTIHKGATVGARAVVTRDVEAWTVVAGNPARPIGHRKIVED